MGGDRAGSERVVPKPIPPGGVQTAEVAKEFSGALTQLRTAIRHVNEFSRRDLNQGRDSDVYRGGYYNSWWNSLTVDSGGTVVRSAGANLVHEMMRAYNDMVNRNEARDVNEGMASVMDVSYRMLEDLAAIEKIVKGEAPADGACDHVLEAVGN